MNDKAALLNELRDLDVPEVSSSLAPGWWFLLLLLGVVLLAAYFLNRRRHSRLWQRQAREELQSCREQLGHESSINILSRCSQLVRKVVLAVDQREQVASLHGEAWLDKLDDICGRPEFSQGIGQLLLDQPYQRKPVVADHDLTALFESIEVLITAAPGHKAPKPLLSAVSESTRSAS